MQAIFMRNIIQALLATPTNANVRQGEQVDGEKALIKTEKQARTVQHRPFSHRRLAEGEHTQPQPQRRNVLVLYASHNRGHLRASIKPPR